MCGLGPSCSYSYYCRSCCSLFLRWKQTARRARTTATEFSVPLRHNFARRRGCLRSSRSDSRQGLFITCSIEVFTECPIRRCARQRVDSSATPAGLRQGKWCDVSPSFSLSRSSLFLRCTLRPEIRRRYNSLHSRPFTLPSLYIARNGRSRDSQAKVLCWSRSINRLARLLAHECSRAPETSYSTALRSTPIRNGASSQAQSRRSIFRLSLQTGHGLRHPNEHCRNRQFSPPY